MSSDATNVFAVPQGTQALQSLAPSAAARPSLSVQVVPLLSHLDYLAPVSALLFREWAPLYALANIHSAGQLQHTLAHRTPAALPLTFIALSFPSPSSPPTLLGTVTLDTNDVLPSCPYFGVSPWMSSLLVVEEARGRGVGRALAQALETEAVARGLQWVWLWTVKSAALYEKWGWKVVEWWLFPEKGKKVAIMRKDAHTTAA